MLPARYRKLHRAPASTPSCACPPASSTPRASRPTSSSSTAPPAASRGRPRPSGSTTCAPTSNFTLKQNPLTEADLEGFIAAYNPANRHKRTPTWSPETPDGRWRAYGIDELLSRDKVNLDIFWLRDESWEDSANLPAPDVIAAEIVEDLSAALEQFEAILGGEVETWNASARNAKTDA